MLAGVRFVTSRHFCALVPFRAIIPEKPDVLVIWTKGWERPMCEPTPEAAHRPPTNRVFCDFCSNA